MTTAQISLLADTWMHGGWGWGWMILMMVVMVLFWGAVILGIVWLSRGASRGGSALDEKPAGGESPLEILERRFAEGSINADDYQARREVLANGTAKANEATKDELVTA
jgi:putative membrane protein